MNKLSLSSQPSTLNRCAVWDGDWAILEEYDATGALAQQYLQGYHGLVKTFVGTAVYYYQDELSSTSHIADASGALLEYYKYDLYGKPTYWSAANSQLLSSNYGTKDVFTGQRFVSEIGLYDDRNRFMSPDLGRFLQPDPVGFKGDASNLYRYCGNDWANRSDPLGLDDIYVPREVDVRLWQASMNSLHEAQRMHDGNGRSQMVEMKNGKISLGSKFAEGTVERYVRPEYTYGHSGEPYGYIRHEYNQVDKGYSPIAPGHVHMDVTGKPVKDSPDFSRKGKDTDLSAAQKGQIVGKVNESNPDVVQRLTPQTDGSKPQVRPINPPTKAELKKWPNPYKAPSQAPQASHTEPADIGGQGFVALGGVLFGERNEGLHTGGTP